MNKRLGRSLLVIMLLLVALAVVVSRLRVPARRLPPAVSPSPTGAAALRLTPDPYRSARSHMVEDQIAARGVKDRRVLEAMKNVPRHLFVPENYVDHAYDDTPLPIGFGQTISQPYIVAVMSELLEVEPGDRVLEIGTGSGYQAAVLAEMGMEVYTVEIIPELAQQAKERLRRLGYTQVHCLQADGYYGWADHAPYEAIIVTAAPDHVPQPLLQQLADGGRLVIPVGPQGSFQTLWKFVKQGEEVKAYEIMGVLFVPLVHEVR